MKHNEDIARAIHVWTVMNELTFTYMVSLSLSNNSFPLLGFVFMGLHISMCTVPSSALATNFSVVAAPILFCVSTDRALLIHQIIISVNVIFPSLINFLMISLSGCLKQLCQNSTGYIFEYLRSASRAFFVSNTTYFYGVLWLEFWSVLMGTSVAHLLSILLSYPVFVYYSFDPEESMHRWKISLWLRAWPFSGKTVNSATAAALKFNISFSWSLQFRDD